MIWLLQCDCSLQRAKIEDRIGLCVWDSWLPRGISFPFINHPSPFIYYPLCINHNVVLSIQNSRNVYYCLYLFFVFLKSNFTLFENFPLSTLHDLPQFWASLPSLKIFFIPPFMPLCKWWDRRGNYGDLSDWYSNSIVVIHIILIFNVLWRFKSLQCIEKSFILKILERSESKYLWGMRAWSSWKIPYLF